MSLKSILMDVFPFLFNAMEKFYDDLPQPAKDALINAGQFSQILKKEYRNGYEAFVHAASLKLGMSDGAINDLLLSLAKKMNIDIQKPEEFFDKLQIILDKGLEDSAWDNLWHSVSGQLAVILSGGRFDWASLAMGLIQFVYKKYIA